MNEYTDLGLTHFVLDLVGLDEDTIKMQLNYSDGEH